MLIGDVYCGFFYRVIMFQLLTWPLMLLDSRLTYWERYFIMSPGNWLAVLPEGLFRRAECVSILRPFVRCMLSIRVTFDWYVVKFQCDVEIITCQFVEWCSTTTARVCLKLGFRLCCWFMVWHFLCFLILGHVAFEKLFKLIITLWSLGLACRVNS